MAKFEACEKHGGHLFPVGGQCELCAKGVVPPASETPAPAAKSSSLVDTRKF